MAPALYGWQVHKGGDITSADSRNDGAIAGQIDHRGGNEPAIAAVQDQIDAVLELFINFSSIGARQFLAGQKQGRAHDGLAQFAEHQGRHRVIRNA